MKEIQDFLDSAYESGIRDPVKWMQSRGLQMFHWLKGAFPRNILPSDCDGEVEIGGHFLRLEFKSEGLVKCNQIPKGQMRQFKALVKTGIFTVFVAGHDQRGEVTCLRIISKKNGKPTEKYIEEITNDGMHKLCKQWAQQATKHPC